MADSKNIAFETATHTYYQLQFNPSSIKPVIIDNCNVVKDWREVEHFQHISKVVGIELAWEPPVYFDLTQYLALKLIWLPRTEIYIYPNPRDYPEFYFEVNWKGNFDFVSATGRVGLDAFGYHGKMVLNGSDVLTDHIVATYGELVT